MKRIIDLVRPNIARLAPYSTARDEFKGEAQIFLDANECAYNNGYNRYPDPRQSLLKQRICEIENIDPSMLFLGNGSDEAIDLMFRIFCEPARHKAVAMEPSYGMYQVCADINDVKMTPVALEQDFSLDIQKVLEATDDDTRLVFLCSPNNPTGKSIPMDDIARIAANVTGIVVVDEAYIHYSSSQSAVSLLAMHPNIVVLRTMSKARGMAGLRIGMAIAHPEVIALMSNVKYPYNISQASIDTALCMLTDEAVNNTQTQIAEAVKERGRLARSLEQSHCVQKVYPSDANFLLVKVDDADELYRFLSERCGIIVRNRTRVPGCKGCLRITVGTPEENTNLLNALNGYEKEIADN